jgi:hypothetical protein
MPAEENGARDLEQLTDHVAGLLREQREKHPEAFERALSRTATMLPGVTPQDVRTLLDQRPDLAAMREMLPKPDPRSSVMLQAEAQRAAAQPYVEFNGTRYFLSGSPDLFDLAEVGEAMSELEGGNDLIALGAANRLLRRHLKDYRGFRAAFRERYPEASEEASEALVGVIRRFMEAATARPTGSSGDSSPGRSSTSTTSRGISPAPVPSPSTDPSGWEASTRESS